MQTAFLLLPTKLCIQLKLSEGNASAFHVRRQHYESLMLNIKGNPGIQRAQGKAVCTKTLPPYHSAGEERNYRKNMSNKVFVES